jgi:hypothetical protein
MTGYDAFCIYLGLKLHFTTDSYDYLKFGGKTKTSVKVFNNRKDRYFFDKLSKTKKKDVFGFLVSNFIARGTFWIGELFDDEAEQIFNSWKKRIQSLTMVFSEDINKITKEMSSSGTHFDDIFISDNGRHPLLMKMVLREDICIESFIIMNKILGFFKQFDQDMEDDLLWDELRKKCLNYEPFVAINNTDKHRKILLNKLEENV